MDSLKKETYIRTGGVHCPYCGSERMRLGDKEADDIYLWWQISCEECKKQWTDEYTLTNILEEDEI